MTVVGHDMGGHPAWSLALVRPDLVRKVAVLSVPARPRGESAPLATFGEAFGGCFLPGPLRGAEALLEKDVGAFLVGIYHTLSAAGPEGLRRGLIIPEGGVVTDLFVEGDTPW